VDRFGAVAAQHVPLSDAEVALDRRGTVEHRFGAQIRFEDRIGDTVGALVVVLVEDDDIAQPFVGGFEPEEILGKRLRVPARGLPVDHLEDRIRGGRFRVRVRIEGDVYLVVDDFDLVLARDGVGRGEQLADRLAVLAGGPDAGNRHTPPSASVGGKCTVPERRPE